MTPEEFIVPNSVLREKELFRRVEALERIVGDLQKVIAEMRIYDPSYRLPSEMPPTGIVENQGG